MDLALAARSRLLRILHGALATSSQCVLLCDEQTLRVISSAVRMSELLEAVPQVVLVDSIATPSDDRAPDSLAPTLDAVYFIEPTLASLTTALAQGSATTRRAWQSWRSAAPSAGRCAAASSAFVASLAALPPQGRELVFPTN